MCMLLKDDLFQGVINKDFDSQANTHWIPQILKAASGISHEAIILVSPQALLVGLSCEPLLCTLPWRIHTFRLKVLETSAIC